MLPAPLTGGKLLANGAHGRFVAEGWARDPTGQSKPSRLAPRCGTRLIERPAREASDEACEKLFLKVSLRQLRRLRHFPGTDPLTVAIVASVARA